VGKWTIKSVKDVSSSSWFPIEQHTIELPDGRIVDDYFITTLADVVMVVPFTKKGKMVLVKQYKHGQKDFLIELPAGFVQKGKSVIASAVAELEEETGIRISTDKLIDLGKIAHIPTKSTQVVYGFLATQLEFNSTQDLDALEDIEVLEVQPMQVIEMVKSGELWVSDSVCFIMKAYLLYPELFKN